MESSSTAVVVSSSLMESSSTAVVVSSSDGKQTFAEQHHGGVAGGWRLLRHLLLAGLLRTTALPRAPEPPRHEAQDLGVEPATTHRQTGRETHAHAHAHAHTQLAMCVVTWLCQNGSKMCCFVMLIDDMKECDLVTRNQPLSF